MRSWRPRRGLVQRRDIPLGPRRGDDPLVIPRLQAWRFEGTEGRFYVIDGATFPSTTTIIEVLAKPGLSAWSRRIIIEAVRELVANGADIEEALQLAESEPERRRDTAGLKGVQVHEAIAAALAGDPYPPEMAPWVEAGRSFLDDFGLQVVAIERVLVSKRHGFAGSCDVVALGVDGGLVVIDWKTGRYAHLPEAALQVGAYCLALQEMTRRPVAAGYVVAVRSGRYEAKQVNLPRAQEGFLGALALWKSLRGGLYG
jgi:antitoxin component HigA of HigAB toxin-antitoxin module